MVIKYDAGEAQAYEYQVGQIADRIEGIIGDRETQKAYMDENFQSSSNSEDYQVVEQKWLDACEQVKLLVKDARTLMEMNDITAADAAKAAGTAIGAATYGG
ncbi:hypothetical protein AB0333_00180 [Citricoccus sp. NPDC079358]|jgi:uncharacterized protein YukE|uniref:hypothetical protein n=1 Tax=Citricoccus sp. NPDC079358 TaxID=3154653 RepID=UPI00344D977F